MAAVRLWWSGGMWVVCGRRSNADAGGGSLSGDLVTACVPEGRWAGATWREGAPGVPFGTDLWIGAGRGVGGRLTGMSVFQTLRRYRRNNMPVAGWSSRASHDARSPGVPGQKQFGGEFDPGSGSTLAACLMHASRTGSPSGGLRGGRVRNTWATCPVVGASLRKRRVIPHKLAGRVGLVRKARKSAAGGVCVRLARWWGHGSPRR